jgi:transcription elongation factor GreA
LTCFLPDFGRSCPNEALTGGVTMDLAMAKTHHLSPSAHGRLVGEYYDLTTRGRIEIADLIERARELGDLKENGDYHAAKDQQGLMEARIATLKSILDNASLALRESEKSHIESMLKDEAVPEHHREFLERAYTEHRIVDGKGIDIRTIVTILYDGDDESDAERFLIGHTEEDSEFTIITPESPIGQALIGQTVDDSVEYQGPRGALKVHVRHVEPA